MTLSDFSLEFDILYNNINSNMSPGFNEEEKSIFLTQAQEQLVLEMIHGNKIEGLESTEIVKEQLAKLVKETNLVKSSETINTISKNSVIYTLPSDLLHIIYEHIVVKNPCNKLLDVVPIEHDSISKILKNPFKGPSKKILRLNIGKNLVELITNYAIKNEDEYYIRYIKTPEPIILTSDSFSIKGFTGPKNCELHESLHRNILQRAVVLAKQVWLN